MNRIEFMQKLESLLTDISDSEREEALQYYNDYLNDAGVENEEEVLGSLGSPEKLARVIKAGLGDNTAEGEFTETGYKDYYSQAEDKKEVLRTQDKKKLSGGMLALVIILCILASPLLIAVGSGLFGAGVGILGGILGLLVGVAATGIALLIVAVLLIGIGIFLLVSHPVAGICLIGAGLLIGGLALFFIWLTVWLWGTALPCIIRALVGIFNRIFHKKGGEAV